MFSIEVCLEDGGFAIVWFQVQTARSEGDEGADIAGENGLFAVSVQPYSRGRQPENEEQYLAQADCVIYQDPCVVEMKG